MTQNLHDILTSFKTGEETFLEITGEPGDRKLTITSRQMLPEEPREPLRSESPAVQHEFLAASGLADYLMKYGSADVVVFADPINETVYAVLNERADDGFEVVTMKPALHPLWAPWSGIAGKRIHLSTFTEFIDHNRRTIIAPEGRALRLLLAQVRACVKVEIQRGRGKHAVNGLVVTTEIQGVDKKEEVELPEEITIRTPLYIDTSPLEIPLDLTIEADTSGISVVVSSGTIADARVAAFQDMIEIIDKVAKEKTFTMTFGRPKHRPWEYLKEQTPRVEE